jgi:hypothetical protein
MFQGCKIGTCFRVLTQPACIYVLNKASAPPPTDLDILLSFTSQRTHFAAKMTPTKLGQHANAMQVLCLAYLRKILHV